jgi:hypothetical protein
MYFNLIRLKEYINIQWENFQKNKYIVTPIFNKKFNENQLVDFTPEKLLNYLLQASESEILLYNMKKIIKMLNKYKTVPILYTYDSMLYDFHISDGIDVLKEIKKIMSFDGNFPIKLEMGDNYQELKQVDI